MVVVMKGGGDVEMKTWEVFDSWKRMKKYKWHVIWENAFKRLTYHTNFNYSVSEKFLKKDFWVGAELENSQDRTTTLGGRGAISNIWFAWILGPLFFSLQKFLKPSLSLVRLSIHGFWQVLLSYISDFWKFIFEIDSILRWSARFPPLEKLLCIITYSSVGRNH